MRVSFRGSHRGPHLKIRALIVLRRDWKPPRKGDIGVLPRTPCGFTGLHVMCARNVRETSIYPPCTPSWKDFNASPRENSRSGSPTVMMPHGLTVSFKRALNAVYYKESHHVRRAFQLVTLRSGVSNGFRKVAQRGRYDQGPIEYHHDVVFVERTVTHAGFSIYPPP